MIFYVVSTCFFNLIITNLIIKLYSNDSINEDKQYLINYFIPYKLHNLINSKSSILQIKFCETIKLTLKYQIDQMINQNYILLKI